MKRVAAAVVLLAVAVGIAVWSGSAFESSMNFFESELLQMIDAPDSELPYRTQRIAESWEEHGDFLHSVFIHEGIDELEMLITSLPLILEHSGKEELIIKCVDGVNLIKNLKSCEKFSFENIL